MSGSWLEGVDQLSRQDQIEAFRKHIEAGLKPGEHKEVFEAAAKLQLALPEDLRDQVVHSSFARAVKGLADWKPADSSQTGIPLSATPFSGVTPNQVHRAFDQKQAAVQGVAMDPPYQPGDPHLGVPNEKLAIEVHAKVPVAQIPRLEGPVPYERFVTISQHESGFVDGKDESNQGMLNVYFRNCSGLFLWNPDTHDCAALHVTNRTNLDDVMRQVEETAGKGNWQITMLGGSQNGVPQECYDGNRYNWVLADRLHEWAQSRDSSFAYRRPTTIDTTDPTLDWSYLLLKESGQIMAIDNQLVQDEEKLRPEHLGPDFTARFSEANLIPYVHPDNLPCNIAYKNGKYTNVRFQEDDVVGPRLKAMERRYRELLEKTQVDGRPVTELPLAHPDGGLDQLDVLADGFLEILKDVIPENDYLIGRCTGERMMVRYMPEELRKYWGIEEMSVSQSTNYQKQDRSAD